MLDGSCLGIGQGLIVAGNVAWTDYQFTAPVRLVADSTNNEVALVFRYVDSNNFYWAGLGCYNHRVSIAKIVAGASTELVYAGANTELVKGQTYLLAVKVVANRIELWVDGALALSVTDASHTAGMIGFRGYNSHIEVDYANAVAPPITVTFSGSVSAQANAGETVNLTLTKPDTTVETILTATMADKSFTVIKQYSVAGQYSAFAHIDADGQYIAIDSPVVTFNISVQLQNRTIMMTVTL